MELPDTWPERQQGPPRLQRIVSSTWQVAQTACVVGGLAALVLVQVPGLSDVVAKAGLENSESLRATIVVLVLGAAFLETHEVLQRLARLEKSTRLHFVDVVEMYPFMFERAKAISDTADRRMDVLGATLQTAWHQINYWLQRSEVSCWKVRLALLDGSMPASDWVPENWLEEAAANVAAIRRRVVGSELPQKGTTVDVYEYDYMPVVRGVRLGNGDLFISLLLWQPDGRFGARAEAYEYIPYDEATASAVAMRRLFDSWFERALMSSSGPTVSSS